MTHIAIRLQQPVQYCLPDTDSTDRTCVTITYNSMMSNSVKCYF